MQKVKIDFPERVLYATQRVIKEEDINYAQHMANERILIWANELRSEFLRSIGWDELDKVSFPGVIAANHTIAYLAEGFLGEEIRVEVAVDNVSECSFDLLIRLTKIVSGKKMIMLRTGIVCYDYHQREITGVPQRIYALLNA